MRWPFQGERRTACLRRPQPCGLATAAGVSVAVALGITGMAVLRLQPCVGRFRRERSTAAVASGFTGLAKLRKYGYSHCDVCSRALAISGRAEDRVPATSQAAAVALAISVQPCYSRCIGLYGVGETPQVRLQPEASHAGWDAQLSIYLLYSRGNSKKKKIFDLWSVVQIVPLRPPEHRPK